MKDSGLGTPATRAEIIENIIKKGYNKREGKNLIATEKAEQFMDEITDFIREFTQENVAAFQKGEKKVAFAERTYRNPEQEILGLCPKCGADIVQIKSKDNKSFYVCSTGKDKCGFIFSDTFFGKKLNKEQVKKLLSTGKTSLITGFISKKGTTFAARLCYRDDFSIGLDFPEKSEGDHL